MFKLWGIGDAIKSGCSTISKTFKGAENKLDEWMLQDERTRAFRDKVSFEEALADASEAVEESNKRLAKLRVTREQFLADIAAFSAAFNKNNNNP